MNEFDDFKSKLRLFQSGSRLTPSFWAIARQKAAVSLPQIVSVLEDDSTWTWRNLLPYRYLGLIDKYEDVICLTKAGELLLSSSESDQQDILDCQVAKVFLANPTNDRLKIEIFPLGILLELIEELGHLGWNEYLAVVIWIHSPNQVPQAISLLKSFRALSVQQREIILADTEKFSGKKDLSDQVNRLFLILLTHSALRKREGGIIEATLTGEFLASYLVELKSSKTLNNSDYEKFLTEPRNLSPVNSDSLLHARPIEFRDVYLAPVPATLELPSSGKVVKKRGKRDYIALAEAQSAAGLRAEECVVLTEIERLKGILRDDLANQVLQLSLEDDSLGYDIRTFDGDVEIHVEVKSVAKLSGTCSVFLSANEISKCKQDPQWRIWVVMGNGTNKPYIFKSDQILQAIKDSDFLDVFKDAEMLIRATQYEVKFNVPI
jgi:hypothetical protein